MLNRVVAVVLCVTVVVTGLPPSPAGAAGAERAARPGATPPGSLEGTQVSYRLRDAVPASSLVAAPPDTTEDDFFLPEETDNKNLVRDITVFVIVTAFVAYFIIKVFIENDPDPPPDDTNGKPITPPK